MKAKVKELDRSIELVAETEAEKEFLAEIMPDKVEKHFSTTAGWVDRLSLRFVEMGGKREFN